MLQEIIFFIWGMLVVLEMLTWKVMCQLHLWAFVTQIDIFRKCIVFPEHVHLDNKIVNGFQGERFLLFKKCVYCKVYKKGTT